MIRLWSFLVGAQQVGEEHLMTESPGPVDGAHHSAGSGVKSWLKARMARPGMRHIVRGVDRFNDRLGTQFAGAITYSSFLAVVPILMVAFSIAGFVLSSQPQLLLDLRNGIAGQLPAGLSSTIGEVLNAAVNARVTVGIVGLVIALYSGVSWMGNVRTAIQAQWRPDFDTDQETREESLGRYYLKSLGYLAALGVGVLASLLLTAAGSWAQSFALKWFGLDRVSWLAPIATIIPILLATAADVGIFYWMYDELSPRDVKAPRRALLRGAVIAAVAFEVLKFLLTFLLPLLLTSTTAKLFGPIIGLLFFFNLVATVVLFVACWIATANPTAAQRTHPGTTATPADIPPPPVLTGKRISS